MGSGSWKNRKENSCRGKGEREMDGPIRNGVPLRFSTPQKLLATLGLPTRYGHRFVTFQKSMT